MLTGSKTKRLTGEDQSCSKNSDHKHSTNPRHNVVVEVKEMVASRNTVSVDPKMLNPVLWSTLPRDLLLLVFARLPVPDIIRLRCLSREWKKDMTTVNSDINQACDEACPIMVVGYSSKVGLRKGVLHDSEFVKRICNLRTLKTCKAQHSFPLHLIARNPINNQLKNDECARDAINNRWIGWNDMCARDSGLICFVSTWRPTEANPLCIVVENLLTRLWRKLPPLQYVYFNPPQMMHIEVDSKTKCYRVVVIGENIEGHPTVEIYDSGARQWTKAAPSLGFIFGIAYKWKYSSLYKAFISTSPTRSVYDFVEGKLKSCDEKGPSHGASSLRLLQKDCKFVLHRNTFNGEISATKGYCITKYRSQNNAKEWVKERSYLSFPFEDLLEKDSLLGWTLRACEGFLMVSQYSFDNHRHLWLLNLATGEWKSLLNCFDWQEHEFVMSRVFWNVMP